MRTLIQHGYFLAICLTVVLLCSCSEDERTPQDETQGILINKSELFIREGQTDTTLFALIYPEDAAEGKTVVWSSDDESVAAVDMQTGAVTAVSVGTARVSASTSDGELSDTCIVTVRPPVSIYAVGASGTDRAAVWHDGKLTLLHGDIATAEAVFLRGEDLYVAGQIWENNGWSACVWKNSVETVYAYSGSSSSFIKDIYVSEDGQALACGYSVLENPRSTVPVLWIDGLAGKLPCESSYSEATSVLENAGTVYVAGYDYNTEYDMGLNAHGILWTNGVRSEISSGEDFIECTDMEISEGILYMCGTRTASSGTLETPVLYVNGELRELSSPSNGANAYATSLCLYEGDIYVSGYVDVSISDANGNTVPRYIAVYWKNDEVFELTDGTTNARALSIEVRDYDVYVGGYDSDVSDTPYTSVYATIWKNGEIILNDRTAPGSVSDMALTE